MSEVPFNPTRVCAWCKLITHIGLMRDQVSHTVCATCKEVLLCV